MNHSAPSAAADTSVTEERYEDILLGIRFLNPFYLNIVAFLQSKYSKATFPSGRASMKHFMCLELISQGFFLIYIPLLSELIRSLCNQPLFPGTGSCFPLSPFAVQMYLKGFQITKLCCLYKSAKLLSF